MFSIIIFMIACFSMASIIVDQKIFEEIRDWIKTCAVDHPSWVTQKICQLVSCYFCTGFWSGVFISAFVINPFNLTILDPFLGGLVGACSAYYINLICSIIEKYAEEKFDIEI